jgi:hypothetical protein
VETSTIIPKLDPAGNIIMGFLPRRVNSPVDQLDFQCPVDRFGQGIIIAYSRAPDALLYTEFPRSYSPSVSGVR